MVGAGALVLFAAGAGLMWLLRPRAPSAPPVHVSLDVRQADDLNAGGVSSTYLPTPGGSRTAFAWTQDGQALVFVGRRNGVQQLYVRRLDAPEARHLAGTEGAQVPAVSRDGQWVAFWAPNAIKKVPLGGGPVMDFAPGIGTRPWLGLGRTRPVVVRPRRRRPHLADPARRAAGRRDDGRRRGSVARPALSAPGRRRAALHGPETILVLGRRGDRRADAGDRRAQGAAHGCRRRAVSANRPLGIPAARDPVRRPVRRGTAGGAGADRGRARCGRAGAGRRPCCQHDWSRTVRHRGNRRAGMDSLADCSVSRWRSRGRGSAGAGRPFARSGARILRRRAPLARRPTTRRDGERPQRKWSVAP